MPRNPQGSVTRNPVLIAIFFFIALVGTFVMFATLAFGVGGGFWATFGVIGFLGAIIFVLIFIVAPLYFAVKALQAGAKRLGK